MDVNTERLLRELRQCASLWEPQAILLGNGNLTAARIVAMCDDLLTHPRPRVGVTAAQAWKLGVEYAKARQREKHGSVTWLSAQNEAEADRIAQDVYNDGTRTAFVCRSEGDDGKVWMVMLVDYSAGSCRDSEAVYADYVALALADEAAPGVVEAVETDWFCMLDKHGYAHVEHATMSMAEASSYAEYVDRNFPEDAPHRVMRVCLKPLANGGGVVELDAGMETPWPVREVLRHLSDACAHLLNERNYTGEGWEQLHAAVAAARQYIANAPLPNGGGGER